MRREKEDNGDPYLNNQSYGRWVNAVSEAIGIMANIMSSELELCFWQHDISDNMIL